jgi:hypothetical protein
MFEKQAAQCAAFAFCGVLKTRCGGVWDSALPPCHVNDIACPCLDESCKDRDAVMVKRVAALVVFIRL